MKIALCVSVVHTAFFIMEPWHKSEKDILEYSLAVLALFLSNSNFIPTSYIIKR